MVTYCNYTYHGDHFEIYRNIKSLCCTTGTNIVLWFNYTSKTNKQTYNQTHRKRYQICGYQRQGLGEGELDEGGQNVQTASYKINKY